MTTSDRSPDTTTGTQAAEHDATAHYGIRIRGHLAPHWSAWFDGMTIDTDAADGTTLISGPVVDQAALHGLLQRLRDVGIPLVSLNQVSPDTNEPPARLTQGEPT